ncbi:thioredoxin-like protein, partial [Cladochytrium replicatum]
CFLGKRRLEQGIEQAHKSNPNLTFKINWHPFQLDPTTPEAGVDRRTHLIAKLGGAARLDQIHAHLGRLGKQAGIDFEFDGTIGNTLKAHRLIAYSLQQGGAATQEKVVEALFKTFHEHGKNLGDVEVLGDAAAVGGLDKAKVIEFLKTDDGLAEVKNEIKNAQRQNIHGVPNFIINKKYQLSGAQEPETFVEVFSQL